MPFVRAMEDVGEVVLTFDQAAAAEHREVEFVTPVHPLARAATAEWARKPDALLGALRLTTDRVEPGLYVFVCEVWETIAVRPDLRLVCLAVSARDGSFAPGPSREFLTLLHDARDLNMEKVDAIRSDISSLLGQLDLISDTRRRDQVREIHTSNELQINRRLASLEGFHKNRTQRVSAELQGASEPRIVRMKTSELARLDADFQRRGTLLERARQVEVLPVRVAAGVLEVTSAC